MGRRLSLGCRLEHVMALHHVFPTAAPTCIARQSRTLVPNPPKKYVIYTRTFWNYRQPSTLPQWPQAHCSFFVSRDFRGLFTLWADAVVRSLATLDKPGRLPADEITTWPLTMLYESTCGTIAKKSFPSSPWCSKFQVAKFGRTEAIKQNSKTRSSKLSCQHQQARNLFTIEIATPIEVTVPSNVVTPATLQRNDTECVTEPHGFSRSADGGRGPQLQRLAYPARRSQPQASHSQNRFQTRAPQRGQCGKGGTKPLTFHARLARITARSVNSHQPALSFGASPPLAAGHAGPRHGPHRHSRVRVPHGCV